MADESTSYTGKRVIFLYPPSVLNEIVVELSRREFEICFATDHHRLARYLHHHNDCLVFVNIDTAMKESEWDSWIRERQAEKNGVGYGIVTLNENKALAEKYLMNIGVSCGFVVLKLGSSKAIDILVRTLEANEARGLRKYIRSAPNPGQADFNVELHGNLERGHIHDISIVGMSVSFEVEPRLANGQKVEDFQLSLKGVRISLSAVVYGSRDEEGVGRVYIFIFNPTSLNEEKRDKIRGFVRRSLQDIFDKDLLIL